MRDLVKNKDINSYQKVIELSTLSVSDLVVNCFKENALFLVNVFDDRIIHSYTYIKRH